MCAWKLTVRERERESAKWGGEKECWWKRSILKTALWAEPSRAEPAINISPSSLLVSSSVALASHPSFYNGSGSFPLSLPPPLHHQVSHSPHGNSDRILQWQQRWNNGNEGPTLFEEMGDRMIDITNWLLSGFLATWWQGFPHAHHHHDMFM